MTIFVTVEPTPPLADVLRRALEAAGMHVMVSVGLPAITIQEGEVDPDSSLGEIHLVVGTKGNE
jgi:hypothetical protein